MFNVFVPDYIFDTIYDIPDKIFDNENIRAVFLDIDNTLVSYNTEKPTKEVIAFLEKLKLKNIKLFFVSNNSDERVRVFAENLNIQYFSDAKKPSSKVYKELLLKENIQPRESMVIGDQIFTDVFAGKKIGCGTILVSPIENVENNFFKLKRFFEVPFKKYYYIRENRRKKA